MALRPRIVVLTRKSEYQGLLERHATHQQAAFFLKTRGESMEPVEAWHRRQEEAVGRVHRVVGTRWRAAQVDRADLDRFLFEPEDLVVAVGQDGLVANAAKYLDGQSVLGLNPDPERYEGVLVPHPPEACEDLLAAALAGRALIEERTMVEATRDDGPRLLALNEIFVGHQSHQSARYRLEVGAEAERHSSSGLIVFTGSGATGWARSILHERARPIDLPAPTEASLAFFVREAWPSVATGTELTGGRLDADQQLVIHSEMSQGGVAFGDGIESDHLELSFGCRLTLRVADRRLALVAG